MHQYHLLLVLIIFKDDILSWDGSLMTKLNVSDMLWAVGL